MIDMFLGINFIVSLPLFVIGIVLLGFIPYLLGYRLFGRTADGKAKALATLLFRSLGILLGLILSMNFANLSVETVKIQNSVELEAKEIAELGSDFNRFGSREAIKLQSDLLEYVEAVINDEWPRLAKGSFSPKAQKLFIKIEDGILNLNPVSQYQQDLKERLLKDIDEISDHRSTRIFSGNVSLNWFIIVVLIGFLMSCFLLCVNPVRLSTMIFISCYSAFIGIVLYSIVALNQPYHGLTQVSVKPFRMIYQTLMPEVVPGRNTNSGDFHNGDDRG